MCGKFKQLILFWAALALLRPFDGIASQSFAPTQELRRLSLTILGRLPTPSEIEKLTPQSHSERISFLLSSEEGMIGISFLLAHALLEDQDKTPDLERFKYDGENSLQSGLSDQFKLSSNESISWNFFNNISNDHPFDDLFNGSFLAANQEILSFYGIAVGTELIEHLNEKIYVGSYMDARPATGIVATPWLYAGVNSNSSDNSHHQLNAVHKKILCNTNYSETAHDFSTIDLSKTGTSLRSYSVSSAKCASCHAQTDNLNTAANSLYSGNSLNDWLSFSNTNIESDQFYFGHKVAEISDWARNLGSDPRTILCLAKKLSEAINHRKFNGSLDDASVLLAHHLFTNNSKKISSLIKGLLTEEMFATKAIKNNSSSRFKKSGLRFLSKREFQGIANQLVSDSTAMDFSSYLNPGSKSVFGKSLKKPSGPYWHASNRLIRQLAEKIIDEELASGSKTENRTLFVKLNDGTGKNASNEHISSQIIFLWGFLTGEVITDDSPTYILLKTLFTQSAGTNDSDEKSQQAWKATLIGVFSTVNFLAM